MTKSTTSYLLEIQKAKHGESLEQARMDFFARTYPRMVAMAKVWAKNQEDADELASSSMTKLFGVLDDAEVQFENRVQLWMYVKAMIKHGAIDYARRREAQSRGGLIKHKSLESLAERGWSPSYEGTSSLEEQVDMQALLAILNDLDSNQKLIDIVLLRYYDKLDRHEICKRLNISERTYYRKADLIKSVFSKVENELVDST